jgi:actin-like ATPase involved in cell morphogenesis
MNPGTQSPSQTAPTPVGSTASSSRSSVRLGVDLGTTWTAASLNGEALPLSDRRSAMPSVVALDGERFVTGDAAERRLLIDPTSGAREMKRRLGDTTPYLLGGTPYGPEALMARLLADVVAAATERAGSAPNQITLTHPANWGEYKLDLLRECARLAGITEPRFLSEPEAAALHYVALGRLQPGQIVAVYDFGGGTFDAAVVRCTPTGAELVGTAEGLERLGGIDIDQIVVAHVNEVLDQQLAELNSDDPEVRRGLTRLRADCTAAKEALSTDSEVSINVAVPGLSTVVRLTRSEFEESLRPRLADTLAAFDRTLHSAGVSAADLAGVVLVGGSSRIPLVRETVAEHTGRPVFVDADPKLVVCMGATDQIAVAQPASSTSGAAAEVEAANATEGSPVREPSAAASTGPGSRLAASTDDAKAKKATGQRISGGVAAVAGVAAVGAAAAAAYAVNEYVLNDDEESLDVFDGGLFNGLNGGGDEDGSPDASDAASLMRPEGDDVIGTAVGDAQVLAADGGPSQAEISLLAALLDPPADGGQVGDLAMGDPGGFSGGGSGGGGGGGPQFHSAPSGGHGGNGGGGQRPSTPRPAAVPQPVPHDAPMPVSTAPTPPMPPTANPRGATNPAGGMTGGSTQTQPATGMEDPELEVAKQTLLERLEGWEPPAGADPAEVAELRQRLSGLIDRHQALPGQSTEEAVEALREQFGLRVHDFTQDVKLDTLIDESERESTQSTALNTEVDAARAQLSTRLDQWKSPEGASPQEIADLKADLKGMLDRYQPIPGQSPQDAIADLRQQFSDRVTDFSQDTRIDGIADDLLSPAAGVVTEPDPRVTMPVPPVSPVSAAPPESTLQPEPIDGAVEDMMPDDSATGPLVIPGEMGTGEASGEAAARGEAPQNTGIVPEHLRGGGSTQALPTTTVIDEFDELVGADPTPAPSPMGDAARPFDSPMSEDLGEVGESEADPSAAVREMKPIDVPEPPAAVESDPLADDVLGGDTWRAEAAAVDVTNDEADADVTSTEMSDEAMAPPPVADSFDQDDDVTEIDSAARDFQTAVEPYDDGVDFTAPPSTELDDGDIDDANPTEL